MEKGSSNFILGNALIAYLILSSPETGLEPAGFHPYSVQGNRMKHSASVGSIEGWIYVCILKISNCRHTPLLLFPLLFPPRQFFFVAARGARGEFKVEEGVEEVAVSHHAGRIF